MDLGIKGKYALITGASHGIGRSIALKLAQEGCNVAICARNKDRLVDVVKEIRALGVDVIGIQADVMNVSDIDKTVKSLIGSWKTIHILVNNAGGGGRWGNEIIEDTPEDVWMDVYNKNVLAALRFTLKAIPFMRKQKWGRVVTITSTYGRQGGGRPWFNIAKTAQTTLMKNLALDHRLVRDGITFNSVAPGCVMIPDTGWDEEQKNNPKEFEKLLDEKFPLGRMGTPEEIANVVAFIASEKASLINGASILVDGGESSVF